MARLRHLVIVLPGIGGSVLARPGDGAGPGKVVWDAGKGDIADLVVRPGRLAIGDWPELEPVGLITSPKLLWFTIAHGYERLRKTLGMLGTVDWGDPYQPVPDADIVAVPYDFRRGVVAAAERLDAVVAARLAGVSEREKAGRVVIVAHSMGGLVARQWLGPMGNWRCCRALITLGTPHRGAPKALDVLVNGVRVGRFRLSGPSELLQDWTGVVDLLPRYPAVRDLGVADPAAAGAGAYAHDLPIPGLAGRARAAYDMHVGIEKAWADMPRSGPEMAACLGWSHPTPDAAYWDGATLTVCKEPPSWLGRSGWENDLGDGTVPAVSALPPEMDNSRAGLIRLPQRHGPLGSAAVVAQLLAGFEGWAPPVHYHGPGEAERPPAIGLDLDQVAEAGAGIPLTVVLREVAADLSGQAVWARLAPVGEPAAAAPIADVRLCWDAATGSFRGELPGQAPGMWRVRVIARDVPGGGDLPEVEDTVAVVEGG